MKTPREILLNRHCAAEPRLDAIRRAAVAAAGESRSAVPARDRRASTAWAAGVSLFRRYATAPWRELILPSRRLWTGLAAVWAVLILINTFQRDTSGSSSAHGVSSPTVMASWQVQQRWMNELLADRSAPPDADRPRNVTPRPRTEISKIVCV
jgi:hypothetical protein